VPSDAALRLLPAHVDVPGSRSRLVTVGEDRQQGSFDATRCGDAVDPTSSSDLLAENGDRNNPNRELASCDSENRSRAAMPPTHLARILPLSSREGTNDDQAVKRLRYDVRWDGAVGVPPDRNGSHTSTLVPPRRKPECDWPSAPAA
jgi:hypothetical protein